MLRHLFGPVHGAFARQHLDAIRQAGDCLTFGGPGSDLPMGPSDTWDDLRQRLPSGWMPDFIALWLPYSVVPHDLWKAPIPLVGLAGDWHLLWHQYRHQLPLCDRVFTDLAGVERLHQAGMLHAVAASLFGLGRDFLTPPADPPVRDIDVLFCGQTHPMAQRERLPWLARLARLGDRWHVRITGATGLAERRELLWRSRICFNVGVPGEPPRRALEAAACGALLFQDATSHRETSDWLAAGREYIAYAAEDLELRLDHYLTHEDRRASLADAAYARVQSYSFEALWSAIVERIHADHHELRSRCARRVASATGLGLAGRVWQALASPTVPDPGLENAIADASKLEPENAHWCHLAGQIVTNPAQAAELFRRALSIDPNSVCSGLALVEAEARVGNAAGVTAAGRNVLAILNAIDRLRPMDRDVGFYHQNYDYLRVEWERASWENAGDAIAEDKAKRAVLAWRLHLRLADSGNDLTHYYEAALIRPELPVMRIALGCALARAGRMVQALPHLKRGVAEQPFDRTAARALAQALHDTGDAEGLASLKRDLLLFSRVAPDLLPPEPWFTANEPAPQSQKPRLTLAILCRDEPELLSGLLADASDLADEVVILDAVGDDSLSKTSRDVGARVVPFTWTHSYGDARNELLTHAHGDWVLWLDPADRLDDAQKQRLHLLIRQLPSANMAFTMRCHTDIGEVVQIRLHRRDPRIRWTYHAREQLSASLAQTGAKIISTDIVISRATMPDMANRRNRLMTDMRLLRRSEELYPRDPFVLSNLAAIYQELGDADKATAYLQTTLDVIGADDPRRPKLIAMLVLNLGRLGNAEDALDLCVEARKQFPNDGELFLLETMARREMGDEARAEQMLRAAVDRGESFVGVAMSLVRGQLAELLRKQERWQEAEAVWRAALIENPDFAAAHEGLATIYLMQKRWIELDSALERLKSIDSFGAELMKARIHLAKGEFGAARWQLSQLIDRHPHVMAPRLLLCNALIEEGKDWHAAERALIDVIERLPDDADAQRNLDLVRRKLGREPLG